jgi:transposase InsO family protein
MKPTNRQRVAAVQEAVTRRSSIGEPEEKNNHHERRVITFSWMKTADVTSSLSSRDEAEKAMAASMCLPLVMNGVDVGVALVDQGASRSVMRRSAYDRVKHHMKGHKKLVPVREMYVVGSTNEYVPVVGAFAADLYTQRGQLISKTLIYVADDKKDNDIVCDLVLGRSSIATSKYSCVDTRGTGSLVALESSSTDRIPCCRCRFVNDKLGKSQLVLTMNDGDGSRDPSSDSHMHKIRLLSAVVDGRSHLSEATKTYLYDHLMNTMDMYDIVEDHTDDIDNEELVDVDTVDDRDRPESRQLSMSDSIRICHLMSELGKSKRQSKHEKAIISELMASFIPVGMRKPMHEGHDRPEVEHSSQRSRDHVDRDEEEVDDIEFPFTPPTRRDDSPEYHAAKSAKIADMVDANEHLSSMQKEKLKQLLQKHADRFSMKGENMERTDTVEHEIDTGSKRPFRERLRQYAPAVQKIIDDEVQAMVKDGVIVPSKSPYASNLLLVRKPDPTAEGGVKNRVCASFVQLNTQTEKDSYPLPNIQYIFDKIGRSTWFTTMDLLSGFWQVMIKPEHRHKTAFITMRGLYEFIVMPFGLCNAPATFQRLMDSVILPEYRDFIETYIDDLMTHSSTFDDHMQHLELLLNALREHKLVVKLSKCKFAQKEVKFLGHVISQNCIKTNPEAVEAIRVWQHPSDSGKKAITAVRSFLGMAGWYRKFIPKFADIARPLFNLTKKDAKWAWTPECQSAFEQIRDSLTAAPVLAVADPNKPYILHTDASDHAMGAILMQDDENGEPHPIAYASKTFNDAQRNYDTTEREALAIIWALQHFNTYCEGHKYTLLTDHAALSYIRSNTNTSKRIHRWQVLLQGYDLQIKYQPGKDNHAADLLSRDVMVTDAAVHLNAKRISQRKKKHAEYDVEKVLDSRPDEASATGEKLYLVKWKGYGDEDNTWEPARHLTNAADAVADYEARRQVESFPPSSDSDDEPNATHLCDLCEEECSNESALFVHRFRQHSQQVPVDRLAKMAVTTNVDVLRELQQTDPELREIFNTQLGTEGLETLTAHQRKMMLNNEFVLSDNGLLYMIENSQMRSRSRMHTQLRLCVPRTERRRVMYHYHDEYAHPGIIHLYDQLRERVWWPRMLSSVIDYVRACKVCQTAKSDRMKYLPRPMSIPEGPWTHIAIDHIGPFPMTNGGHKYILIVVDRFTRYAEGFACTDESAYTTATLIIDKIICRYGFPQVLLSDRGSGFSSTLMQQILKVLRIKKIKTTAYHPKSNGGVEIINKTIKKTLKLWVNEHHNDWDVLLPYALFAYNSSMHATMHETPYYMNFGRQPRTAIDNIMSDDLDECRDKHAYARELAEKLFKVHQRVIEIYKQVNEDRAEAIEKETRVTYSVGDQVWLFHPTTPKQRSKKLIKRWRGPYVILRIGNGGMNITLMKNDTETTVNVDRIRPYDHGVESIEDQHTRDIELATHELDAINNTIRDLMIRKKTLLTEQQVSASGRDIERQQDDQDRSDMHPEPYDFSDEDSPDDHSRDVSGAHLPEAISLTSMDFVLLW